ncbi:maltokinase N-terminal cap-like domain-containing protein [Nocardioides flavescens]|uniref:maltokinase N-terminal cap-like domain-containing protein n=1 Tax=Nocardioides flavescens TaxID=2691959 RepID=UPI00301E4095
MSHLDPQVFATYLERTRWFGGKGRAYDVTDVSTIGTLPGEPPLVVVHLVEVTYADGSDGGEAGVELYQVPLAFYEHPEQRLDHAFVGWWEDPDHGWVHAYDALHDREAMALWQRAFDDAAESPDGTMSSDGLVFHRLPGHDLDLDAQSSLFSGEQSNSSVRYGEDALMKVFRKVTPGRNPDISVHEVLTEAGSTHVAHLYGWLETVQDGEPVQLAMLQQFLRTATDGWELALASVRSLYADLDVHAHDSGGDFAGEASRLGEALREVHETLHEHFPAERRPASAARELADAMVGRLEAAAAVVPELAEHTGRLRGAYDAVAGLGDLDVQQVHGDLHLGQTLRTSIGWKIVDFEGEPAKPLAERQLPDSPWRDVAGMLRSFDYAPRVVQRSLGIEDGPDAELLEQRAQEWAERNKNHFLTAYAGGGLSAEQQTLLDAYVADKAVYETVYETRNRPSWVGIPLQAVAKIGAP